MLATCAAGVSRPALAKAIGEYSSYEDSPKKSKVDVPEVFQPTDVVPEPQVPAVAAAKVEVPEEKLPDAYAEPISPQTVQRFKHLKPYQGHLVLGGATLQVVLAGVPAKEPAAGWQPAVLAVFELRDGYFQRSAALAGLDLNPLGDAVLFPIGVDLGTEKTAKLAFVTQVYAASEPKVGKQAMTWRFDAEQATLAMVMGEFGGAALKAPKGGHKWKIRLKGDGAGTVIGKGYWQRFADADVVTFFPYRHLNAAATATSLELEPKPNEGSTLDGFELLLGRDAAGRTLARAASLEDCLFGTQKPRKPLKEEAKLGWILACQVSGMKATLRLVPSAADQSAALRPVYVFSGDGVPLLYTALDGSKDSTDLLLPVSGETYQLADTRHGRVVPGTTVIAPVDGQTKTVEVPALPSGLLRIAPGTSKAAAILTVRRFDRDGGSDAGIVAAGDGDSQLRLAKDRLLIRSWPADLELEAGGYQLTLSRGGDGTLCAFKTQIQANRRVVLACDKGKAPGAKDAPDQTYLDLAAAEGRDLPLASMRQALGVDLLAEPVDETGGRAAPLRVLRFEDDATGTVISFVPATAALAGRWEKQRKGLSHEDLTTRFVRLVRGEGGPGIVELGCPGPGTSGFDYELLVQRVQPDAVRLFGCAGEARDGEWLALYDRLAASRRQPYLLTPESGLRATQSQPPRLLLRSAPKTLQQKPETLIRALLYGAYEIRAGGGVSLTKVTRTPKTGMVADVAFEAESPAAMLALYGENGLIKEEKVAASGQVSIPLRGAETSWLRAELRDDRGVVATTPATEVAKLLPKDGESH